METSKLSETLVHVIFGFGFPTAEQLKFNTVGAVMFLSIIEVVMLLGGARK